ncbi:MAG: M6 family metalloprotease domain-containing protein [Bacteroidaceae bacterium]|nr:M6 family metalloprotease domain-containing protein [Bacteroidaceae bacterium]
MTHFRFLRPLMSAALVLMCATAFAVPAKRVSKTVTLTDGTQVTVTLRGDENLHYYSTADGRIVEQKADGTYDFVSADRMKTRRAKAAQRRESMEKARRVKHKVGNSGNYIGQKKGLVILVNFKDKKLQSGTASTFPRMANEVGYKGNGHYGSVHDYFLAQSYGQFDLTFDVVGPVTVSQNMAYYGAPSGDDNDSYPAKMVIEAINLVDDSEINFADYDWDNDGYVDQVYVIYAGYGEASGASEDTIWPHEWDLDSANYYGDGTGKLKKDGKWINTYACSNELDGKSGTKLDGIGTMCHEFSHCLGLPDFYDTEGNNFGMDSWSIMDYGCYNSDGCIPCGYTAYERMFAGWLTPTELDDPATITGMPDINDQSTSGAPKAYIIYNDANSNEFYTLQNIQQTGWNQGAYGHGLLVSHIDFNQTAWTQNKVNTSSSHQRGTIIHADNEAGTSASSLAGDTFPGTSKNTSLTNITTPAATLYNNNSDGKKFLNGPLTEITETGGLISFLFDGGEQAPSPELAWSKTYLSVDIDESGTPSFPTLTNTHGVSVTYESSNTAVATVSNTGVVTLTGTTGTTTVSAIFAGNDDYQAQTVTYTIVVYSSSAGDQPAGTLWEEDFGTNFEANKTTYQYDLTNTTFQTQNSTNTNILAGGESPELLIKANKTFSAVIPMNGHYGDMTLTFKSNRDVVTTTADGATLGDATITGSKPYVYTIPVSISAGTEDVTLYFKAGSDNARFDDARLYQGEDTPTPQDPELSWSAAASSARINATDNLFPTLTNPHSVTVSYESSNTAAATVNATTGAISLVAPGVTTISAIFAGNASYTAKTVTFQLTVLAAEEDDDDDDDPNTLWSEDFHTYSANDVPTGGTYGYVCVNGGSDTKVYTSNLSAGGTSPELLIGKNTGSFSATIPMNGHSGTLTLSFLSNKNVSVTVEGATLGTKVNDGKSYTYPVTVAPGTQSITLTFATTTSDNARVDNFLLVSSNGGSSDPVPAGLEWSATAYTATIGATNTFPTLTNPYGVTVSYESSNTAAATIDATTGAITLVAPGTTTISASFDGNASYEAQTVTYTLTVEEAQGGDDDDDEPVTLWSEDFSSYAKDAVPDGGTYGYACVDGGSPTKIWAENTAGGTSPELLIGKNTGSFSATIPMNGHSGTLTLSFVSNKNVSVTVEGATLGTKVNDGKSYTYPVTVAPGTQSITLTFATTTSDNARVDNFLLVSSNGGSSDPVPAGLEWSATAYTATIGATNTFPTLTNPYGVTVSYESSNTAAATIDATTGAITLVAPGTTTISASFDGNASYEAQTVTYTLTVEEAQGGDDDDEPVTLWSEDFGTNFEANTTTYQYDLTNTTIQTQDKTGTNILAGGESPELLIKANKTFSAVIPMNGHYGNMTLTFKSNRNNVSTTADGATLGDATITGAGPYIYTIPVSVSAGTQNVTLYFKAGSSNARFDDARLYKGEDTPTLQDPELTWSTAAYTATIGATNTFPTLTNPYGVTVSYESSNTDAATIDASTGAITLVAPGTTTISASFDGNASYEAQTVTYTLTVEEAQGGDDDDDEPVTLWSEDFSSYAANDVPTGGTYGYSCTGSGTKIYNETTAGGTSPELLINGKNNGTFSATIPMNGHSGELTLTFLSNKNIHVDATGATLTQKTTTSPYTYTVNVPTGTESVEFTFSNDGANCRVDNFLLTAPGNVGPQPQSAGLEWSKTSYTATIGGENLFPTLTNPHGVTVSYSSSTPAVATIDATTGAITPVAPGLTTISAIFAGNDDYQAQTVTYDLAVSIANDITNPYTIAQAYDLIDAGYDLNTWVYVKGVISNITEVDVTGTFGNATYDIRDNTTTAELHIFRGYGLDNVKFNAGAELIQIGDEVIVYGQLYYYAIDDLYEMKQGNYIVSHTHPAKTLDFADGTTYSEASAQTYDELTYTRTFGNTSWQALYLPFSLSYDDWKDELDIADIYNIIQYDDDNNGSFDRTYLVILHKTSGQTLPNRPYLVRAKTAGTFTCTLNDVELQPAEDKTIDCSSTFYTYSFTGNYAPREGSVMIANGDYALGGGELHKAASDAVLKAQRWYMHITPREGAPTLLPRAIGIIEHGEETEGIALTTDNRQQTTAGFDITGRAVNAANGKQRGITIVNGKKVIR